MKTPKKYDKKDLDGILTKINIGKYSAGWVRTTIRGLVQYILWLQGEQVDRHP